MTDFAWFPRMIVGLIAAIIGINVLLTLLAPYGIAILLAGVLIIISMFYNRLQKRKTNK